jgi:hypothetical protein
LDLTAVKKGLEELNNSNLINIKNDDKYLKIYELKMPFDVTRDIIINLHNLKNVDNNMIAFLKS